MLSRIVDSIVEFLRPFMAGWSGYLVVAAATFLENSMAAGVIVPGETLVILGGFYASQGDLTLWGVIVATVVGAVLGDNVGYLIGRRWGRGLLERHGRKVFITPERLARADAYYRSHGGKTVFLGRFIPVVRSIGVVLAGVSHVPWRRFLAYDVAGATLWGVGNAVLGFLVGESYKRWEKYSTPGGIVLIVLVVLLIWGSRWLASRRQIQGEAEPAEALASPDEDGETREP